MSGGDLNHLFPVERTKELTMHRLLPVRQPVLPQDIQQQVMVLPRGDGVSQLL